MMIRNAQLIDHTAMMELVEEFFEFNDFKHLEIEIDLYSVALLVEILITEHVMLVLESEDGKIVGGVGGLIMPFLFNQNIKLFQELFFYIKKDFRKHNGKLLITELKKTCQGLKLNRMILGYPMNGRADAMNKLYKMWGFKKLETHFIARI